MPRRDGFQEVVPLAWTKNLAMFMAAGLALTLDPALRMLFARMDFIAFRPRWLSCFFNQVTVGRYYAEEKHPISRLLFAVYEPACRTVLRHPSTTIAVAVLIVASTVPAYLGLGHEFMTPLNEGRILYMPTTLTSSARFELVRVRSAGAVLKTPASVIRNCRNKVPHYKALNLQSLLALELTGHVCSEATPSTSLGVRVLRSQTLRRLGA